MATPQLTQTQNLRKRRGRCQHRTPWIITPRYDREAVLRRSEAGEPNQAPCGLYENLYPAFFMFLAKARPTEPSGCFLASRTAMYAATGTPS